MTGIKFFSLWIKKKKHTPRYGSPAIIFKAPPRLEVFQIRENFHLSQSLDCTFHFCHHCRQQQPAGVLQKQWCAVKWIDCIHQCSNSHWPHNLQPRKTLTSTWSCYSQTVGAGDFHLHLGPPEERAMTKREGMLELTTGTNSLEQ